MSSVAIITARGGSKRIPRKNIKEFCGKPILLYSVEAALQSGAFDEVMISTDDEEIAELGRLAGASIPFFRSAETSGDFASTDDVIMEVLKSYEKEGLFFDRFCCIYPTAPFLTPRRLSDAMELLDQADSVLPVVPFSYPPQRGLILNPEGELRRQYPEHALTRSQDLPTVYHDAGQFYACRTAPFMAAGTTDVDNMIPLILPETEVQDIDTEEDWRMAELKYHFLHS